jgi:hypothetical protein
LYDVWKCASKKLLLCTHLYSFKPTTAMISSEHQ